MTSAPSTGSSPENRGAAIAQELQRRLSFERRITAASAALMRSDDEGLDAAIGEVLGSIGGFFAVDRAYLFLIDHDRQCQSNTHEWVAPGISTEAHNLQEVPLTVFPWLLEELEGDRVVSLPDIRALPNTAINERAEFEREGIQSIAIVPMWDGARLSGFVGFDAVRHRVEWGEDYLMGLRLLAQMLGSALRSRTMARQLRAMAFHDPLTGLPNRKRLQEQLDTALGDAVDQGTGDPLKRRPVMVAMVDLDDFKRINDAHGHAVGDAVLREAAVRLQQALREQDTVARLGGDEFVVVVDDGGKLKPKEVARRLRQAFVEPIEVEGHRFKLGLSIGMAIADGSGDADRLLRRADAAMYRAKDAGKDRWECDPVAV